MKVLKWMFIVVAVLAVTVCAVGFVLPDQAHVERTTTIDAPPAKVFTVLNGFRQFNDWSPWAELDPNTRYTFEGPETGVGSKMTWVSDDPSVGGGSQEIIESEPVQTVATRLIFVGFDSDNIARYTLVPEGTGTRLTWSMDTDFKGNLMGRYIGVMMDGMTGPDFEKGLAKLKTLVESQPDVVADVGDALPPELVTVAAKPIAWVYAETASADAAANIAAAYGKVGAFMALNSLQQGDAPMAITQDYDPAVGYWKFHAAIPLTAPCTAPADSEVKCGDSYAGRAIKAQHRGAYTTSVTTYNRLLAFKAEAGLEDNGNSWEHYIVDPTTVAESDILTDIYWPVK